MTPNGDIGPSFDDLLEQELRRQVGNIEGPSPRAAQASYQAAVTGTERTRSWSGGAAAKLAAGLTVALLVLSGGAIAVVAAETGSSDPAVWGDTVVAAVQQCKDQLAAGAHGIGQCVSDVAQQHGAQQRAAHAADKNQKGKDNGNGDHPGSPASDHPGNGSQPASPGKPSDVPNGPPNSPPGNGNGNANGIGNGNGNGNGNGSPNGPAVTPPGHR